MRSPDLTPVRSQKSSRIFVITMLVALAIFNLRRLFPLLACACPVSRFLALPLATRSVTFWFSTFFAFA